jgi:hypothetical protein
MFFRNVELSELNTAVPHEPVQLTMCPRYPNVFQLGQIGLSAIIFESRDGSLGPFMRSLTLRVAL